MNGKTDVEVNNAHGNIQKLHDHHITLCDFLKSKSNFERMIQFLHFNKIDKINNDEIDTFTKTKQ